VVQPHPSTVAEPGATPRLPQTTNYGQSRYRLAAASRCCFRRFKQLNHKQLKLLKVLRDSVGDRDRAAFKRAVKQGKKVSKKNDSVATKLGAPACAS